MPYGIVLLGTLLQLHDSLGDSPNCATFPRAPLKEVTMSVITILVVDDAEYWRRFISFILRIDPAMEIVSEASNGTQALQEAKNHQPTIVLLDIGLPGINGIEAGRRILREAPNSKIIYVSQESDIEVVQEALAVGAAGYVSKIDAGTQLVAAMRCAMRGQRFISTSLPAAACTKH